MVSDTGIRSLGCNLRSNFEQNSAEDWLETLIYQEKTYIIGLELVRNRESLRKRKKLTLLMRFLLEAKVSVGDIETYERNNSLAFFKDFLQNRKNNFYHSINSAISKIIRFPYILGSVISIKQFMFGSVTLDVCTSRNDNKITTCRPKATIHAKQMENVFRLCQNETECNLYAGENFAFAILISLIVRVTRVD